MNLNSFKLCNSAKINYLNTLCRCVFALLVCAVCLFPSVVGATGMPSDGIEFPPPTGYPGSGGGSTRGGGAGRRTSISAIGEVSLTNGYVDMLTTGKMRVISAPSSSFKVGWFPVARDNPKTTAEYLDIAGVFIDGSNTFLEFYNWNGYVWTRLGATPYYSGSLNVELPAMTTAVKIVSTTSNKITYRWLRNMASEEIADTIDPVTSRNYAGNLWASGIYISSDTGSYYGSSGTKNYATINYWPVYSGDIITVNSTVTVGCVIHFYDSQFRWVRSVGSGDYVRSGTPKEFLVNNGSYAYAKMSFTPYSSSSANSLTFLGQEITIEGFYEEAVSVAFQADNTSKSGYVNYYYHVDKSVNITNGDGSTIVIGDNNEITVGTPGTGLQPGEPVPIPGAPPPGGGDSPGDDDPTGDGFWDNLIGLFTGLGNLLKGIISFIMIPINLIIDTVGEILTTLTNTVEATTGMGNYLGALFTWLPAPLPGVIVSVFSAMLIIALVKFLRG